MSDGDSVRWRVFSSGVFPLFLADLHEHGFLSWVKIEVVAADDRFRVPRLKGGIAKGPVKRDVVGNEAVPRLVVGKTEVFFHRREHVPENSTRDRWRECLQPHGSLENLRKLQGVTVEAAAGEIREAFFRERDPPPATLS
jgi:hypothetical protein